MRQAGPPEKEGGGSYRHRRGAVKKPYGEHREPDTALFFLSRGRHETPVQSPSEGAIRLYRWEGHLDNKRQFNYIVCLDRHFCISL